MTFRFPSNTQRVAILGRTGSGKTQFGAWLLSNAAFDKQPYIIVDYKGDELFGSIDRIKEIGVSETLPKHPGLYVIRPMPSDEEGVEKWLWKVWAKEYTGLYFDEAYALPKGGNSEALRSILTQGRSKRIPAYVLSQRPAWVSRFVFSEADFYALFRLNIRDDAIRVHQFAPKERVDVSSAVPEYHSFWYDVQKDTSYLMKPVPSAGEIAQRLFERLAPKGRKI